MKHTSQDHSVLVQREIGSASDCHSAFADTGYHGNEIAIVLTPKVSLWLDCIRMYADVYMYGNV